MRAYQCTKATQKNRRGSPNSSVKNKPLNNQQGCCSLPVPVHTKPLCLVTVRRFWPCESQHPSREQREYSTKNQKEITKRKIKLKFDRASN